jgi:hypothetical protein
MGDRGCSGVRAGSKRLLGGVYAKLPVGTKSDVTVHCELAVIRDLIQQGMRLVVDNIRETRKDIRELRAAQKRTGASLKELIDSMRGGGNGHAKRKVDLR